MENGTCYYYHDVIRIKDFGLSKVLLDQKPLANILIYHISYKTLFCPKHMRIRFDGTRYLPLSGSEKHNAIYNRISYLS